MRPTYETPKDRENQRAIFRAVMDRHAMLAIVERRDFDPIDGDVFRIDRQIGFMEVKRRFKALRQFPTLTISCAKIDAGFFEARERGLPLWLAIQWNDALGIAHIRHLGFREQYLGRTDRNDPHDKEWQYHIPIDLFACRPLKASAFSRSTAGADLSPSRS